MASCSPFTVREVPGKGRGLFATRQINPGEIILEERPLLSLTSDTTLYMFLTGKYPTIDEETRARILQLPDPAEKLKTLDAAEASNFRNKKNRKRRKKKINDNAEPEKILRIFEANSLQISPESDVSTEAGLYDKISVVTLTVPQSRSLHPNAMLSCLEGDSTNTKQVRAIKLIEKDQQIFATKNDKEDSSETETEGNAADYDWRQDEDCYGEELTGKLIARNIARAKEKMRMLENLSAEQVERMSYAALTDGSVESVLGAVLGSGPEYQEAFSLYQHSQMECGAGCPHCRETEDLLTANIMRELRLTDRSKYEQLRKSVVDKPRSL